MKKVLLCSVVAAALISMFKTSVSFAPDYYAPKVFDLQMMSSLDMPGSQCWPFYLESYTAMLAVQSGSRSTKRTLSSAT